MLSETCVCGLCFVGVRGLFCWREESDFIIKLVSVMCARLSLTSQCAWCVCVCCAWCVLTISMGVRESVWKESA
jgi:hypothetical protein